MSDLSRTPGSLRLSKGTWLFAPDGADVLLRVTPQPSPSPDGFFSQPISARLELKARASRAGGAAAIEPRTGIPDRVVGRIVDVGGDGVVVDAGIPFFVRGVVGALGDALEIDVDVDAGITCGIA